MLRSWNRCWTPGTLGIATLIAATLCLHAPAPAQARAKAPGAPGDAQDFSPGDKHGLGTSATSLSKVWFTLRQDELSEVYYPDLEHRSIRDLTFVVGDEGEQAGTATVERLQGSLTYRQTLTKAKHWRLTKTYVTDPDRQVLLIKVQLASLDGKAHRLALSLDPALYGNGDDDVGWTRGHTLFSHDAHIASALVARPALTKSSSGYAGSDNDLLDHDYDALVPGNVVQAAFTDTTGLKGHTDLTLAIGFAKRATLAREAAAAALNSGFDNVAVRYAAGWAVHLAKLKPAPIGDPQYENSLLLLRANEDKGAPGTYPLAHPRDTYTIATAEQVAGDVTAASRALTTMLDDKQALSVVLAWQLGRFDAWKRVRAVADAIARQQESDSPSGAAAQIAALVCAADIAARNKDGARAASYSKLADKWQAKRWTGHDPSLLSLVLLGVAKPDDALFAPPAGVTPTPEQVGQRGEYELAAGRPATASLNAMTAAANDGGILTDEPFAAAQAEYVRLAWSAAAGRPALRPGIVACRYAGACA